MYECNARTCVDYVTYVMCDILRMYVLNVYNVCVYVITVRFVCLYVGYGMLCVYATICTHAVHVWYKRTYVMYVLFVCNVCVFKYVSMLRMLCLHVFVYVCSARMHVMLCDLCMLCFDCMLCMYVKYVCMICLRCMLYYGCNANYVWYVCL